MQGENILKAACQAVWRSRKNHGSVLAKAQLEAPEALGKGRRESMGAYNHCRPKKRW